MLVPFTFKGYTRILLVGVALYFMPTDPGPAIGLYLLSALLDAIDGNAARYFDQCSCCIAHSLCHRDCRFLGPSLQDTAPQSREAPFAAVDGAVHLILVVCPHCSCVRAISA